MSLVADYDDEEEIQSNNALEPAIISPNKQQDEEEIVIEEEVIISDIPAPSETQPLSKKGLSLPTPKTVNQRVVGDNSKNLFDDKKTSAIFSSSVSTTSEGKLKIALSVPLLKRESSNKSSSDRNEQEIYGDEEEPPLKKN